MKNQSKVFAGIAIAASCFLSVACCDDIHPPAVKDQEFTISENSAKNALVGSIVSNPTDVEFAIAGGNESKAFAIDATSGKLTVSDSSKLDFETTSTFELIISTKYKSEETRSKATVKLTDMSPPAQALVSYYNFQETVLDQVSNNDGNAKNLTYTKNNPASSNTVGNFGGLTSVSFPISFDYEKRTISLWLKVAEVDENLEIIYSGDNENIIYGMTILSAVERGGAVKLIYNVSNIQNEFTIQKNAWFNATFVVNAKKFDLYLNGLNVHTEAFELYQNSGNSVFSGAVIGSSRASERYFKGSLDELRIYNRALAKREVELIFHESQK